MAISLNLSVSTGQVIGQFSDPYSSEWPAKLKSGFVAKLFRDL